MECRPDYGARCTVSSIFSLIPDMPDGKPTNTPCVQLDESLRYKIFASPLRPETCGGLQPGAEMCGRTAYQAMVYLIELEALATS